MKRREFITLLGGAAAAWPLAARAQQAERMRRIGVLMPLAADDPEDSDACGVRAGTAGIWLDRRPQHPHRLPLDCGRYRPHAQIRSGIGRARAGRHLGLWRPVVGALHQASRTMPIVFTLTVDPVGAGFVASLARPGGNVTGFTAVRVRPGHEMAGAAQRDRTARGARGHPSRCEQPA